MMPLQREIRRQMVVVCTRFKASLTVVCDDMTKSKIASIRGSALLEDLRKSYVLLDILQYRRRHLRCLTRYEASSRLVRLLYDGS